MDKQLKTLLNNLKCPVCKAQIDIAGRSISSQYNYSCSGHPQEYVLFIDSQLSLPIRYDRVIIYDEHNKYIVVQVYGAQYTVLDVWKVDAEGNLTDYNNKTVKLNYILFDYQKMDREKIVRRLKTVMVFG
jgi:hypothetical protein